MPDVVRIDEALVPATGKDAALVPCMECPFDRRRHDARFAADTQWLAAAILHEDDLVAVAGDAPDRLDRQTRPAKAVGQRRLIDVHGDLVLLRDAG